MEFLNNDVIWKLQNFILKVGCGMQYAKNEHISLA